MEEKRNTEIEVVKDTKARKYQITINNPLQANPPLTHQRIKDEISKLSSVVYWCMCDEVAQTTSHKTPHTHVFLMTAGSPIRFSTIQRRFSSDGKPYAHVETAYGSAFANRQYLLKEGKWADTQKSESSVEGSFEEYGEIPSNERMSHKGEMQFLFDMVESGFTTAEILRIHPEVLPYIEKVDKVRQLLLEEEYKNVFRKLDVIYVFGRTDAGKTRSIMEREGYGQTYRITDYASNRAWDRYKNQKVVCFEEFHSSFPIQSMLVYLDGYPLDLPARYNQKTACYNKVYITTNIPLEEQYVGVQRESPETWKAFLRRIHRVIHYQNDGIIKEYTTKEYLERETDFFPVDKIQQKENPFL